MASTSRSYASGNFMLNLDGVQAGFLKSVEGGGVTAEVIEETVGPGYFTKKHIGQPKYEEFILRIGLSMNKAIYDWIAASWQMNYTRKNGSIVACDYKLESKGEREFDNALITETTIPAMDASAKDPAYMTLSVQPESIRFKKGSGKAIGAGPATKSEQKLWLRSNFKLEIAGLDCTKVDKVDAFTVKQTVLKDSIGDARDHQNEPGKVNFPNLKISLAEASAQTWIDWHEGFVIKGGNDESNEKNGSLIFLSPNMATELGRISFYNLGIFRLALDPGDANAEQIKRVTAELYCERMEFQYGQKT